LPFDYLKYVARSFTQSQQRDSAIRSQGVLSGRVGDSSVKRPGLSSPSQMQALAAVHGEIIRREDQAAIISWLKQCRAVNERPSRNPAASIRMATSIFPYGLVSGLRRALFEIQRLGAMGFTPFDRPAVNFFLVESGQNQSQDQNQNQNQDQDQDQERGSLGRPMEMNRPTRPASSPDAQNWVWEINGMFNETLSMLIQNQRVSTVDDLITSILRDFRVFARRIEIHENALPPRRDNAQSWRRLPLEESLFDDLANFADRLSQPGNEDVFQDWLSVNPCPGQALDGKTRDAVERVLKVIADWDIF